MGKRSVVLKWYIVEHWLYTHRLKKMSTMVYHFMQLLFGCSIPPKVVFGKKCKLPHYHGIVIHQDTVIGDGTSIFQNVTIGGGNSGYGAIIGNNCIIGAGACILGRVHIGNNVKIGANAVVLDDIPDNCTVVGIPGRIIKKSE
jgi:serine O-acetyltransferase